MSIWSFFKSFFSYVFKIFKRTAKEVAKKIPSMVLRPIQEKIKLLASDSSLSGIEKMKRLKFFARDLLKEEMPIIGKSLLDTFLQNVYMDLKLKKIIK